MWRCSVTGFIECALLRHPFVKLRKHEIPPRQFVLPARFLVVKAGMGQSQVRAAISWLEFHGDNGFRSLGAPGSGDPGQLNQARRLQSKEATVVGVASSLEMRFEIEGAACLGLHSDCARSSEPAVELFCPGAIKRLGWCVHVALGNGDARMR